MKEGERESVSERASKHHLIGWFTPQMPTVVGQGQAGAGNSMQVF